MNSFDPDRRRTERPVRRVLLPVLSAIDVLLQRLVPPRRNRIVYASTPDYADNAVVVYRHLLETRRDLEHVWLVRDQSVAERIRREFEGADARGHQLRIRHWSMRAFPTFLRAGYVFHTHGIFGFSHPSRGRVSVCLWHGMPVKAIRRLHRGDHAIFPVYGTVHLATSAFFRYMIASAFDVHPDRVLTTGLPRADVLKGHRSPVHDRESIAAALGIDPDVRWLLWMPTHRSEPDHTGTSPARSFLEVVPADMIDALERACARHDVQVIVKLHPFDLLNERPVELDQSHLTLIPAPRWEATGIQLYDLIAASEGLLTDISSVFIDYLHTGRPIGVLGFDAASYTRETLFDPELLLRCGPARRLSTPGDVEDLVAAVVGPPRAPGRTVDGGADADLALVFNEDQAIASTEAVVDAVGL